MGRESSQNVSENRKSGLSLSFKSQGDFLSTSLTNLASDIIITLWGQTSKKRSEFQYIFDRDEIMKAI